MSKVPSLSDKELVKWVGILGAEKIKWLWIKDDIRLSSEQLDKVLELQEKEKNKKSGMKRGLETK